MTVREAYDLKYGDEVYWEDPDNDECSKYITIDQVEVVVAGVDFGSNPEMILLRIWSKDGDYMECLASELS